MDRCLVSSYRSMSLNTIEKSMARRRIMFSDSLSNAWDLVVYRDILPIFSLCMFNGADSLAVILSDILLSIAQLLLKKCISASTVFCLSLMSRRVWLFISLTSLSDMGCFSSTYSLVLLTSKRHRHRDE